MRIVKDFLLTCVMAMTISVSAIAQTDQKELAIAQMNSCVNTLTNIINNKSMAVLEHESDELLNNLTVKHMVGLPEIAEFRVDLIDAIGNLGITEEERSVLRRVNSIKEDNLKWKALSGALNNTMLITGGGNNATQLGFQALLTAARTGIEYKASKNDLQIEELQAMWELRKNDLNAFIKLRKEALDIIFRLYQKYNLKESDRLTEQSSLQFQKIISEPDAKKMVRLLTDNAAKFNHLADYYYYLGMGYLDCGNIGKANECFTRYDEIYGKAPIYRTNEKKGMISLARLTYNKNMTAEDIEKNINDVLVNLPNNSMAAIQCAVMADKILKKPTKSLSIMRAALDNESIDDKTAVMMASSLILPKISNKTSIYKDFLSAYVNQKSYDIDAAINIWIAKKDNVFAKLKSIFTISDLATHPWMVGEAEVSDKMIISCPSKYTVDLSKVQMFVEKHDEKEVTIYPYILTEKNALSLEKVNKVGCFKQKPNLKYLYMDACGKDRFIVKDGINYNAIQQETYPRQSEFNLSEKDIKNIIKFLKDNAPEKSRTQIVATKSDQKLTQINKNNITYNIPSQLKSQSAKLRHTAAQKGRTYVKFILDDVRKIEICYIFDPAKESLIPCYIETQGKKQFANAAYMKELGYSAKPAAKKATNPSVKTQKKATTSAADKGSTPKNAVKKTPTKTEVKKETPKKEKSWWNKLTGGDDKTDKKESEKKSEIQKDTKKQDAKKAPVKKEDKSWWDKLKGGDDKANKKESEKKNAPQKDAKKQDDKKNSDKKETNKEVEKEKSWWKVW